jgi:hypothetical protein
MAIFGKSTLWRSVFLGFTKPLALIFGSGLFFSQFLAGADLYSGIIQRLHQNIGAAIVPSEGRVKLNFPHRNGGYLSILLNKEMLKNTKLKPPYAREYDLFYASALPVLFILEYSLNNSFSIENIPFKRSTADAKHFKLATMLSCLCSTYDIAGDWLLKWDREEQKNLLNALYVLFSTLSKKGTITLDDISDLKTNYDVPEAVSSEVIKMLEDEQAEKDRAQRETDENNQKIAEMEKEQIKRESEGRRFLARLPMESIAKKLNRTCKRHQPYHRIYTTNSNRIRDLWETAMNLHNLDDARNFDLEIILREYEKRAKYEYQKMDEYEAVSKHENTIKQYQLRAVPKRS